MTMAAQPKLLISKKEYEGLIAERETAGNQSLDEAAASAKTENETFRRDMGEVEAKTSEDKGETNSSSSDDESAAEETVPLPHQGDRLTSILPCRRKKQAAKFIRSLTENPQVQIVDRQIFFREKLVGNTPTILQHVFGSEKLGARQIKMLRALQNTKGSRRITVPSPSKASPKKISISRDPVLRQAGMQDVNPDMMALIRKYRLKK